MLNGDGLAGDAAPTLPPIPMWEAPPPDDLHPILQTGELVGRTNASARIVAHVLRNMLLLRITVGRDGEHEQSVWSMLDESLGSPPTTPTWIHTVRYWCGIAPRPPEDLGIGARSRSAGVRHSMAPHGDVLVTRMPDQRAASVFPRPAALADWFPVEARTG